jgi:hypothetical protein
MPKIRMHFDLVLPDPQFEKLKSISQKTGKEIPDIIRDVLNVKDHVNSPPLGSLHFPIFGREELDGFGLNFFRYDSPSMIKW